jgi:hypothetical protein
MAMVTAAARSPTPSLSKARGRWGFTIATAPPTAVVDATGPYSGTGQVSMDSGDRHARALQEPALRTTVTVHYQTVRDPSQRSISAGALERHAEAIRADLTAVAGVLAAAVEATALPGGASVWVDVTVDGVPPAVIVPALEMIGAAAAQAERVPEMPRLEESAVMSIHAERA